MLACKDTKEEQKDFSHFGMDVQNSRHAMKVIADKKLFFYYRMLVGLDLKRDTGI